MKQRFWLPLLATSISIFISVMAVAQSKGDITHMDYRQKATSKETKRWTLQEWLEQKERNRMMDLWLGMYAPNPYEFFISGSQWSYDTTTSSSTTPGAEQRSSYRSMTAAIGAYSTVIGLQGEYENNVEEGFNDLAGSLNIRVVGNAVQGTHLILNYGLHTRNQTGNITLRQQFAGADLDLYVTRFFGLHGAYRSYLPASEVSLGEVTASRTEGGLFLDFSALRVFGNWVNENQSTTLNSVVNKSDRTGIQGGIKFFF